MQNGKLIIFSAPSGSGKTTIVHRLLERNLPLEFSISATSRAPRGAEQHGIDYYFLSTEEFQNKISENAFVEHEEVYAGCFYGTLKSELTRIWGNQHHVLFDVDVKGGVNLKKLFGNQALSIFVKAPSIDELRNRLNIRGTETHENIEKRIARAEYELSFTNDFDVVVVNENLDKAVEEAYGVIMEFLRK